MPDDTPFTTHTLTGLPVDQRGHRHLWRYAKTQTLDADVMVIDDKPITDGYVTVYRGAFPCGLCDAYPGWTVVDNPDGPKGYGLRAKTACPLPDGAETTIDLVVASGRIIVADNLRPVFNVEEPTSPGYNSVAGQAVFIERMADLGCAYGPTTNTTLDLVEVDEGRFVIVSQDPDEPSIPGNRIVSISCGLWAYSIADYDTWLVRGGNPHTIAAAGPAYRGSERVVEVPNGTYRFSHHTGRADFDPDQPWPIVYAHIERLKP